MSCPSRATTGACSTPGSLRRRLRCRARGAHHRQGPWADRGADLRPRPPRRPARRQAFRILRQRTVLKTGETTSEVTHGLTSPGPDRAGPAEVLALNRGHWEIENRLHYVRDFSCDEDRSRTRSGKLPRNLACLANAAISIVRLRGRFEHQPQAQRYYAAKQGEALREVTRAA